MATTTKPIRQVTKTITPAGSNLILLDDGISMGKATLSDGVSAVAGDLIDTAIDDLDLGTAAQSDAVDFATAAQGAKADSAVQPGDIGTMATETASDYTKTSDLAAVATSNDYGDLSNLPTLGTGAALDAPDDPDLSNDTDKLALRGVVDASMLQRVFKVDTPDDIATASPPIGAPSINVLGYPMSPGARHDWVRAASEPTHPMKEQDATGQWWEISPFEVKAEHFGTWGHNKNGSDALDNALQFLIENQYGTIILPAGRAILDRSLVKTIGATTQDNLFAVCGNGRGSTLLQVDAASLSTGDVLGFHQASLGINNRVSFRDFTVVADGVVDGYALVADRPAGGISKDPLLDVFNVSVYGKDYTDDCFTGGLNASGSLYPNIQWFSFNGAQNQGSSDYSDSSLFFTADVGINLDNTYGGWLFQNIVKFCKTGLTDVWTSGPAGEGIYLDRSNFVVCQVGVKYARNPAEPSNKISGCHFHCRDVNLWVEGAFGGDYSDNSFYMQLDSSGVHTASPVTGVAVDFYSKDAYDIYLGRNRHRGQAGTQRRLYYFDAGTNDTVDVVVDGPIAEGCTFSNLATAFTGQKIEINDPVIAANSTVSGAGQLLGGNHSKRDVGINYRGKPKLTRLSLTGVNSIPNGAVSAIGWNSEQSDDLGLHANSPNPSRVTIPARAGIRKVRITANVQFASNDTGVRQLALYMNGAVVQGGFSIVATAASGGIERLNGVSDWIDVTDDDYFEVMVYQNSGAALDVVNGAQTWVSVEVG